MRQEREIIEIDGSILEGGGQILRTSLALSALTGRPIRIYNIRAKRSNPGLQAQHLTGVRAVAELCNAKVEGAYKGSMELIFIPGKIRSGKFRFDIGTAGSISLVIQAILPVLVFAPDRVEVEITGGTDVRWSPPIDYVRYVMLPILSKLGVKAEVIVYRRGHYPRGGGHVKLIVEPVDHLNSIVDVERGEVKEIRGRSHCVKLPKHVSERQARAAEEYLRSRGYKVPINIELEYYPPDRDPHLGPGSGIVLWAITDRDEILGGDALGEKGKPAEEVGREAAEKLVEDLSTNMAFDRHMGDMLIPYIALAEGYSKIGVAKLTLHTITNVHIVEKILNVKFKVQGEQDKPGVIEVNGIGYRRRL
ncbi:MAG: RNA 3'-terminal phosphate cyclase [Crenarchaeota archaeon]|nr:RNA 3'-terminal phosphate cyclase [Thermoproteota archaeon]